MSPAGSCVQAWDGTPVRADAREVDEAFVLSQLLAAPGLNAWEVQGIRPGLFEYPLHRAIAAAFCAVRDSGQRLHWRRVGVRAGPRGSPARRLVRALRYRAGIEAGLTAAISRLHKHSRRSA